VLSNVSAFQGALVAGRTVQHFGRVALAIGQGRTQPGRQRQAVLRRGEVALGAKCPAYHPAVRGGLEATRRGGGEREERTQWQVEGVHGVSAAAAAGRSAIRHGPLPADPVLDRKSTRLNSSHVSI